MPQSIDRFTIVGGVVCVAGWSSEYRPGAKPSILNAGLAMETITHPVQRADVAAAFGSQAAAWGFRACAMGPSAELRPTDIGLQVGASTIPSLSALRTEDYRRPYDFVEAFFDEVNATGGTVVEIGARARSGNTSRERFGGNVRYLGVDIAPGPNVDIVADAHHLSEAVAPGVDYLFSISTFEHFLMPWKVSLEINKVLKLGGKVLCHSHQTWPMHDEPWDYFRFSPEAWGGLFNRHTGFRVCAAERGEPVTISSHFNPGGPFEGMDNSPGYAMSICVAEKVAEPSVAWDGRMSDIQTMEYAH